MSTPQPPSIPDHVLLTPIGKGSYGTVWLALNTIGTYRAVKIVQRDCFSDTRPFERELAGIRKFEPISRSHEGFVDVLQVGINEEEGYFYYVMELGDDHLLGQQIDANRYSPKTLGRELGKKQRIPFRECLELGLALSLALSELHKRGLVHRDVKPSNIIFVNGIPKLADIGLVADANEAKSYVGTLGFIPPEGPGTPQADVYGLGKVLYEISTGKDRQEFPELPTLLAETPEHNSFLELNEVILRACRNECDKRYQTAWEMHADLLVLANGKSLKRLKILESRFSNVKRLAFAGAILLALLGALAYQIHRQKIAVIEARLEQDAVSGNAKMQAGDLLDSLPYFADALQIQRGNTGNTFRARFEAVLAQCPRLTYMGAESKAVSTTEISPDGNYVLIAQDWGDAKIYNLQSGRLHLRPFGGNRCISGATFSPDGKDVITIGENGIVSLWETATLKELQRWSFKGVFLSARFSKDGQCVVLGDNDGYGVVLNIQSGRIVLKLNHGDRVRFADFSFDGSLIVTCGEDHLARLWDVKTGKPVGKPLEHRGWVYHAAFSHDGKRLVTASGDHVARVWDVETCRPVSPSFIHDDAVTRSNFSPDDRLIMTSSLDGKVRLWHADDYQPDLPNSILVAGDRVTDSSFDKEGRRIICACSDGSTRVWDRAGCLTPTLMPRSKFSRNGQEFLKVFQNEIELHFMGVGGTTTLEIKPGWPIDARKIDWSGRFFSVVSAEDSNSNIFVKVFDSTTGKAIAPQISVPKPFKGARISKSGKFLVTYGQRKSQVWKVLTQAADCPPVQEAGTVSDAFFSPDENEVVTLSGNYLHVWFASDGKDVFPPLHHEQPVTHAEYSPNGSLLLSSCADDSYNPGCAQVWNALDGVAIGSKLRHRDGVLFATWSPDGSRIATASEDFSAGVWESATGKQIIALHHKEKVTSIAFSSDGKWVLTASADHTAQVWSAETGAPITPPLRHVSPLAGAKFLEDGNHVVSWDQEGMAYYWQIPIDQRPPTIIQDIARLLSRNDAVARFSSPSGSGLPLWQKMRDAYPLNFSIQKKEIKAWHEFQAQQSEKEQDWFAASFHLGWLSSNDPQEHAIESRLVRAQESAKLEK